MAETLQRKGDIVHADADIEKIYTNLVSPTFRLLDSPTLGNAFTWPPPPTGHFYVKVDIVQNEKTNQDEYKARPILGNSLGNQFVKFDLHLTDTVEALSYSASLTKLGLDGLLAAGGRINAAHLMKTDIMTGYHQVPIAPHLWPTAAFVLPKMGAEDPRSSVDHFTYVVAP